VLKHTSVKVPANPLSGDDIILGVSLSAARQNEKPEKKFIHVHPLKPEMLINSDLRHDDDYLQFLVVSNKTKQLSPQAAAAKALKTSLEKKQLILDANIPVRDPSTGKITRIQSPKSPMLIQDIKITGSKDGLFTNSA